MHILLNQTLVSYVIQPIVLKTKINSFQLHEPRLTNIKMSFNLNKLALHRPGDSQLE